MRPLHNALAAAIALAFAAGTAAAATTTVTSTNPRAMPSIATASANGGTGGTYVNNAPGLAAQSSGSTSNTVTTTTTSNQAVSLPNATSVDVRNQQTMAATAITHASGSTSAIDNLIAEGAAGPGVTTTGTTGTTTGTTLNPPLISGYAFGNPSDVTSLPYAANTAPVTLASNATLGSDVIANAQVTQFEAARNGANVNRAIAQVQRDRKRIGRNGQLLYSIAPRTNVDRSAEMPDDGPPPSLTGSYSTLTR